MSGAVESGGTRLGGKVVLIVGAASGIGAAITERCLAEGAKVIAADLAATIETERSQTHDSGAIRIACDVRDGDSMRTAVEAGLDAFSRIDGLVYNAAAPSADGTVVDLAEAQWRSEIDIGLTGAFLAAKATIPAMVRSGGGSIVFVASQFAHVATGKAVAYCAAKAGLVHLAKAMAVDHAEDDIRVNSLSPGAVATSRLLQRWPDLKAADAGLGAAHLLGRIAAPSEVAAAAAFLLSPDASFVTGTDLLVDGGYATR